MKNKIWLLVLLFSSVLSFSQDSLTVATVFPENIHIDELGNKYRLIKKDTLVKISVNPTILQPYVYSNTRLGQITSFNIQNPLRPIINHSELSTLVFTDSTLRETSRLFLPDLEIFSPKIAFAQAYDSSLWIYDDFTAQLIQINEEGRIRSNSLNLVDLFNRVPIIASMQMNRNYIVLEDKQVGFLVFDQFGGYIKTIPLSDFSNWKLNDEHLVLLRDNELVPYPIEGILIQ